MSRDTNVPALLLGTPGTLVVMSTLLVPVGGADALEQAFRDRLGAVDGWPGHQGLQVARPALPGPLRDDLLVERQDHLRPVHAQQRARCVARSDPARRSRTRPGEPVPVRGATHMSALPLADELLLHLAASDRRTAAQHCTALIGSGMALEHLIDNGLAPAMT